MSNDIRGAVVEIVERRRKPDEDSLGASICVPNEVRLNGQVIAIPQDQPIIVHEINGHSDCAMVTLTVFARRVFVGHEDLDPGLVDAVDAARKGLLDAQRRAADTQREAAEAVKAAHEQVADANRQLSEATRGGSGA